MTSNKTLSLLFIIDHLSSGGAQRQMVLLACELVKLGHGVTILVYRQNDFHSETLRKAGVKVELIEKKSKYSIAFIRGIANKLKSGNFDAIVSYLTASNLYAIFGRWLSGTEMPLVVSERSSPNNPNYGRANHLIERLYRFADRLVTNSHHLREYFENKYQWCNNGVTTIWNGVDLEKFNSVLLPNSDSGLRFVAIGQIGPFKQAECMIKALAILRDDYSIHANITWYARRFPNLTPDESAFKNSLDELIAKLSLENQWKWAPESKTIELEIKKYHCLVHGSIVEGLPNAICEALASGRPVIASDTLDHPRLIKHGSNGFLFEKSNPNSLANAMCNLCSLSSKELQTMGNSAAKFAKLKLAPRVFAENYEKLILDLRQQYD